MLWGYALAWFNAQAILSVFEKVAWLQIKVHSNFRFELKATRIRLLSTLILSAHIHVLSPFAWNPLSSHVNRIIYPRFLIQRSFSFHILCIMLLTLRRKSLRGFMWKLCFHLARVHFYLSSKQSFVSGFEGKISWASIISKKSSSKEMLKKRHNKKV